MSVADDFRAAVKLMSAFNPGNSARSIGVPQDAPNYSAKSLSGAFVDSGTSGQQSGLASLGNAASAASGLIKSIGSIFA